MKWFKHDSDAHRDVKMQKVLMRYKADGYAVYWYCLELIAGNLDKTNINFELEHDAETIGYTLGIDQLRVEEMMRYMVDLGLFEINPSTNRVVCLKLASRLDESASKNPEIRRYVNSAKANGLLASKGKAYVYIIHSHSLYKIGKTSHLYSRLADIKTTNPHASLIHAIECDDPSFLEAMLHKQFAEKRTDGEWFALSDDDLAVLCSISDGNLIIQEGFPTTSGSSKKHSVTDIDQIRSEISLSLPLDDFSVGNFPSLAEPPEWLSDHIRLTGGVPDEYVRHAWPIVMAKLQEDSIPRTAKTWAKKVVTYMVRGYRNGWDQPTEKKKEASLDWDELAKQHARPGESMQQFKARWRKKHGGDWI